MRISTEVNEELLEVLFASAARHSLATCGLYAVSHGTFPRPRQDQVVAVVRGVCEHALLPARMHCGPLQRICPSSSCYSNPSALLKLLWTSAETYQGPRHPGGDTCHGQGRRSP